MVKEPKPSFKTRNLEMNFTNMTPRDICKVAMNCNSDVNPALANMRFVFEKHQDPADWKNPFVATPEPQDSNLLQAGIIWFHGTTALVHDGRVASPGYQG